MHPSFFKSKHILVVEDCAPVRTTIKAMLQTIGFEAIHMAKNSNEALKKAAECPFDYILCDFNLGECKDGYQLFEALKKQKLLTTSCCFIIISAEAQRKIIHGVIELQPDDYLLKPFNYPSLAERITRATKIKIALRKTMTALSEIDYDLAIKECDKVLRSKPELTQTSLRLKGEILIKADLFDKAKKFYEQILAKKNLSWARLGHAISCFELGIFDETEEELTQLSEFDETKVEALDWLARLYVKQTDYVKAMDSLNKAAIISPKNVIRQKALSNLASIVGNIEASARIQARVVTASKFSIHDTAENYLNHARSLIDLANTKKALERAVTLQHAQQIISGVRKRYNEELVVDEIMVVQSRLLCAKGSIEEAKKLLANTSGLIDRKISIETCFDASKAHFETGNLSLCDVFIEKAKSMLKDNFLTITQGILIEIEQQRHTEVKQKITHLNLDGLHAYKSGLYGKAADHFAEAFIYMPSSNSIALNLLQAMTKLSGLTEEHEHYAYSALSLLDSSDLKEHSLKRFNDYKSSLISAYPHLAVVRTSKAS